MALTVELFDGDTVMVAPALYLSLVTFPKGPLIKLSFAAIGPIKVEAGLVMMFT